MPRASSTPPILPSPNAAPGIVRFFADGVEISGTGGVTADTSDGDTTFSWTPTSVGDGTATISATYTSSSANYASQATSTNDNVTINPYTTSVTLDPLANTGTTGVAILLSAGVSPTAAPGTIRFFVTIAGVTTEVGSDTSLTAGGGTFLWTPTVVGTYQISAAYESSSGNYASDPTSSNNQNIVVSAP